MNRLFQGIGKAWAQGATLNAVRRLKNLNAALQELNRRPVGRDGIPHVAYVDPLGYSRWNPNILHAIPNFQNPLESIQEGILYYHGYEPDPVTRFVLDGRELESGTIGNRIIERAIARKLSANFDAAFTDSSYGFRPRRSPEIAIRKVREAIRHGAHWAFKTDIENFFENIDRGILLRQLAGSNIDPQLICLIFAAITSHLGLCHFRTHGLPQGNIISPVLSNLYLHGFDKACARYEYFRYADDILVLGRTQEELLRAKASIEKWLTHLRLTLNSKKTLLVDLYREPVVFLGFEIRGGNVYPPAKAIKTLVKGLQFQGHERGKALMEAFANRYSVGKVRKLFRRLDREIRQYYPSGIKLTGLLDRRRKSTSSSGYRRRPSDVGHPKGEAAFVAIEKTRFGRPLQSQQPGAADLKKSAAPRPKGSPTQGEVKDT